MLIVNDNNKYDLELKDLANMLFAGRKKIYSYNNEIKNIKDKNIDENILQITSKYNIKDIIFINRQADKIKLLLQKNDNIIYDVEQDIDFKEKSIYKKLLFKAIVKNYENISLKWGTLTGIRPVKMLNELKKNNVDTKNILSEKYMLSDEKINLIQNISGTQDEIAKILKDDISIYISIPFCPSRCNYCSFFSIDIKSGKKYIKDYLKNLDIEIKNTLALPYFKNKNITSIYVGGGTPSSLDSAELDIFFDIINNNFELKNIKEFTFEAGRVDTLTKEKLDIIYKNKVNRISINPQTMNDATLVKIGRLHDSKQVEDIFNIARQVGFDNINMDMILGLADETIEDMRYSIDKIISLNPESITVHCLAIKRASDINTKKLKTTSMEISDFMQEITDKLNKKSYYPYYLYRQKNMLENGENIGYSKEGKYCLYNVAMMDEMQSIIAFGAGSSSKIINKSNNQIDRIPNYKDVILYNNNIDEMIKRKEYLR